MPDPPSVELYGSVPLEEEPDHVGWDVRVVYPPYEGFRNVVPEDALQSVPIDR